MVSLERMSFFRHMPNCVCQRCGKERERFMIGKKVSGKYVQYEANIEEFNNMIKERYDVNDKKFSFKGRFNA